jgi:peptide/nickel transport system substrate-binding protein
VRRYLRPAVLLPLALLSTASRAGGQAAARQQTVVIAVGQDPATPIPTLLMSSVVAREVSELLFLPLASLGPNNITAGEKDFVPQLARSWHRRDSLTLVFEIDPRARWHDGAPVTAADAALALNLARDSTVDPGRALLLRHVASAAAEDVAHLVVRFTEPYDEQFYDAVYHVSPLPAHLLDTVPRGGLARSAYAGAPVGNGPYRWVRRVAGQQLDLAANEQFFRGAPGPRRVTFLVTKDPEAQINLLLSGAADVLQTLGPVTNVARVSADPRVTLYPVPSLTVGYLLFNQRDPGNLARPHPILADREVRAALALALDVRAMVQSTFGPWASIPFGPVPQLSWIRDPSTRPASPDPAGARALLRARGWVDTDGDGVLDRNGKPLELSLSYPATSAPRAQMALLAQEQLRQVGVRITLNPLEGPVWAERRGRGNFDIDFSSATLDPSPSGLVQSWSCAGRGGSNVAHYCDPAVDSLLDRARHDRKNGLALYRQAIRTIVSDAPAVFIFSPTYPYAVASRIRHVEVNPVAPFSGLWRWNPGPLR